MANNTKKIVCVHELTICPDCSRAEVVIDRSYDIPYISGYSTDGHVIYISRRLPRKFITTTGITVRADPYLIIHEVVEKSCMDFLAMGYNEAHNIALAAETSRLLKDHIPPDEYYGFIWREFDILQQQENVSRVPKDLDIRPYQEDQRQDLVEWIRQCQLRSKSK